MVEGKGKEKGPRIVKEAKQQRVSLLVLEQKKAINGTTTVDGV